MLFNSDEQSLRTYKYHQSQLASLAALLAEERMEHARLLQLGNASYCYYQQAVGEITKADYLDWLEGLPANMRRVAERTGFEQSEKQPGIAAAHAGTA